MNELRSLTESEIDDYLEVAANAFPMIKLDTSGDKEKIKSRILKSVVTGLSAGAYGIISISTRLL